MEVACTKSELDVFRPVDVQVALTQGRWLTYYPLNPVSNAQVIEFNVPGSTNEVLDMNNISVYVRGKFVSGKDGAALADASKVAPVNNFLGSLFSDVDVAINGQLITRSSREYPYKDYLQRLLFTDIAPGIDGELQYRCLGWYMDQAGKYEDAANTGAVKRQAWIKKSAVFEFQGRPAIDIFDCDRALHPGQDLHLKFHMNNPKFFATEFGVAADAGTGVKLELLEVELQVRRVAVADTFVNEINNKLTSGNDAIYPFVRREFSVVSIAKGTTAYNKENLFQSKLAHRYTVGFVDVEGYTGSYSNNPFLFTHSNITDIGLYEDGQPIGGRAYKVDFENNSRTIQCYQQLLETVGAVGDRTITPAIQYQHFVNGSTLFSFTRAPDLVHGENHLIQQSANLTLKIVFGKPTTEALVIICMAEYDSVVRIDKSRNVITDYPV